MTQRYSTSSLGDARSARPFASRPFRASRRSCIVLERGLLSPQTCATDPEAVSLVGACLRRADRRGMYTAIRSVMLARRDLTPVLPEIAAPTLMVTGDQLPVFAPAAARTAAATLPHGTSAVIAGTRHLAPLEAAQSVVELVVAFWRDVAGTGVTATVGNDAASAVDKPHEQAVGFKRSEGLKAHAPPA